MLDEAVESAGDARPLRFEFECEMVREAGRIGGRIVRFAFGGGFREDADILCASLEMERQRKISV